MQYVIAIVPPTTYGTRIAEFQRRWPNNQTPLVVEPHVTVKAQGGLTPDLAWMDPVAAVCAAVPRFTVSFTGPEFFGDAVLYLGVASESLRVLHERLVDATSPEPALVERYFELDRYVPHLTLGQTVLGMMPSELKDMHYEAD